MRPAPKKAPAVASAPAAPISVTTGPTSPTQGCLSAYPWTASRVSSSATMQKVVAAARAVSGPTCLPLMRKGALQILPVSWKKSRPACLRVRGSPDTAGGGGGGGGGRAGGAGRRGGGGGGGGRGGGRR